MNSTRLSSWFEEWPLDVVETTPRPRKQATQSTGHRRSCTLLDQPPAEEQVSFEQEPEGDTDVSLPESLHETPQENTLPSLRTTGYHLWTIEIEGEGKSKAEQWSLSFAPGEFPYQRGSQVQYMGILYEVVAIGIRMVHLRFLSDLTEETPPLDAASHEPASKDSCQESHSHTVDEYSAQQADLAFPEVPFFSFEVSVDQLPKGFRTFVSKNCRTCWVHEVRETTLPGIYVTRIAETPHMRNVEPLYLDAFQFKDAKALDSFRALTNATTTPSTIAPAVVRGLSVSLLPEMDPDDETTSIKKMLCSQQVSFAVKERPIDQQGQGALALRNGKHHSAKTREHLLPLHDIVFVEETGNFNEQGEEEVMISPLYGRLNSGRQSGRVYRRWLPTQVIKTGLLWNASFSHLESHEQCRLVAQHLSEQVMLPSYTTEEHEHAQGNEEPLCYLPIKFALEDDESELTLTKEEMRGCKRDQEKMLCKVREKLAEPMQRLTSLLEKVDALSKRGEEQQGISYSNEAKRLRAEHKRLDRILQLLERVGQWYSTFSKTEEERVEHFMYSRPLKEMTTVEVYKNTMDELLDKRTPLQVRKVIGYVVKIGVPVGVPDLPLTMLEENSLLVLPKRREPMKEPQPIIPGSRPMHLSPKSMTVCASGTRERHRSSSATTLSAARRSA